MILVIHTEWNEAITEKLSAGATEYLKSKNFEVCHLKVPGALEIPLAIKWKWDRYKKSMIKLDGVVACGCVIRGETHHFDIVANESARALMNLSLQLDLPVGHAILCVNDINQADARTRGRLGNKGIEAAQAVDKMLQLKDFLLKERSQ